MNIWNYQTPNIINEEINKYLNNIESECFFIESNKKCYNIFEKYIYDLVSYHCSRLNINMNEIFIQYSIQKGTFHTLNMLIDRENIICTCPDKKNPDPIFTIINFLNEEPSPIIVLDVNKDKYMYKKFNDIDTVSIMTINKNDHIVTDKFLFYGLPNQYLSTLKIFIYRENICKIIYKPNVNNNCDYNECSLFKIFPIDKTDFYKDINQSLLNTDLIEELIYGVKYNKFSDFMKLYNSEDTIIFKINKELYKIEEKNQLYLKYGNIIKHIYEINEDKINNDNRFLQRCIHRLIYSEYMCKWICKEIDNLKSTSSSSIWKNKNNNNNTIDDILIESNSNLFRFVIGTMDLIIPTIRVFYNIDDNLELNITEFSVVKYNCDISKNYSEFKKSKNFLNIYILLNDVSNCEGAEIVFSDNLKSNLKCGDMIVFTKSNEYIITPLKKGIVYYLVCFLDIKLSI